MVHDDFTIGCEFTNDGRVYQCVDIAPRIIIGVPVQLLDAGPFIEMPAEQESQIRAQMEEWGQEAPPEGRLHSFNATAFMGDGILNCIPHPAPNPAQSEH